MPTVNQRETVALVSCVKGKTSGPCPAKNLYTSALFRYMRAYAERHADRWFILSAKYGLLNPETVVVSYEQTLNRATMGQRREWAERVFAQMGKAGLLRVGVVFLWLAGAAYKRHLSQRLVDFEQTDPLAGMGIGKRLGWLKKAVNE